MPPLLQCFSWLPSWPAMSPHAVRCAWIQSWRCATSKDEYANLAVEEGFQAGVARAADGDLNAAAEHGDVGVFAVRLDLRDAFKIDDVGAMDAQKAGRVEGRFQVGDGLLLQVLFAGGRERDVVVLSLGVIELRYWNDRNLRAFTNRDTIEILRRGARAGGEVGRGRRFLRRATRQALLGTGESGVEAFGAEWFQQVIHGVDFEGL